ncbi:MAG: flippase-like domain-containing protein [Gammaproteobacteria bacterium]|nr:flippase-like domain-containing protein [Gammaproteobacteria bacterium]
MTARARRVAALNLLLLAALAALLQWQWGWNRLLAPWRELPPASVALAAAGLLASYGLRALRIYWAEPDIPQGRFGTCLRLVLLNNAFNWLLPMRSGEASFPILMRRWFEIPAGRATGVLVWLRLLDLHVLAATGVVCIARGWLGRPLDAPAQTLVGLLVAAPIAVFALRAPLARKLAPGGSRPFLLARQALDGLPKHAAGLARDLLLTWSGWGVKLAALGWLLARLAALSPALGVLGAIGGDASTVLPVHAPGGFGTYEAGVLAALAPARAPTARLLAAAVDLHLFVFGSALVAGAAAWLSGWRLLDSAAKP